VIQLPRRSVTRFFVPLIDVLILLFGIFLLLPYVSEPPPAELDPQAKEFPPAQTLSEDVQQLQQMVQEMQRRIERMEQLHQRQLNERLQICVLHIDPQDGQLYYYDAGRQDIRNQRDAQRLIQRQKALASSRGQKELYFLILWPRVPSAFPTQAQEAQYRQWFRDVPLGFDRLDSQRGGQDP
jgi:hypothetical protein